MEMRQFGRTGLKVPVVGFGGARLGIHDIGIKESVRILKEAFDLGVRYFDTARSYGDSEEKIGLALNDVRDEYVLTTKVQVRGKEEAERSLRQSLRNLRTESVDIVQLHAVDDLETLKRVMSTDGALQALREAKSKGQVRFIGITGHVPYILSQAIRTGEFDAFLVPLNVFEREATEELLSLAKKMNIAFVVMKPFLLHYDQHMNIVRSGGDFERLLGEDKGIACERALRFVIAHDVSSIVPGFQSLDEVRAAVKVAEEFRGLAREEKKRLKYGELPPEPFCRECGLCMPCPEFIDIRTILRLDKLFTYYGLREYAPRKYQHLSTKAYFCVQCGQCEPRCPYRLPIVKMLQEAEAKLGKAL